MASSQNVSVRRLLIATSVVVLLVHAFLPARFSGHTRSLGEAVDMLLTPLADPMHWLSTGIRRSVAGRDRLPDDLQSIVSELPSDAAAMMRALSLEVDQKDQLIVALNAEAARLRDENRALRNLRRQVGPANATSLRFPTASVVGGSSDPASGVWSINRGSQAGLAVGQPVVNGADLVGRIVTVSPLGASFESVMRPERRFEGLLVPPRLPGGGLPVERRTVCQFVTNPPQRFVAADIRVATPVEVGDYLRLLDRDWPDSVQGMVLGRVIEIQPVRDQPLLKRVVVRPRIDLTTLSKVTVIVEGEP